MMAVLVIAGLVLVDRLRDVSALQDCLMTRATNCSDRQCTPPIGHGSAVGRRAFHHSLNSPTRPLRKARR